MSFAPALVELLQKNGSVDLVRLREENQAAADVFSTERHLGDEEDQLFSPVQRSAIIELISASLPPLISELEGIAASLRQTMKKAMNIRFGGAVTAALFGGLTGLLALLMPDKLVQALTSFVSMFGGVAAMCADQFERAPSGARIATAEEFGKVLEARTNLEILTLQIARDSVLPIKDKDLSSMLAQLDQLSLTIMHLRLS